MRFVDTNILIYAVSEHPDEAGKQRIALRLLKAEELVLSVQVLQEFYHQATHPRRKGALSHRMALAFIDSLSRFPVLDINVNLFWDAVATSHRFRLSYWDGAILGRGARGGMRCRLLGGSEYRTELRWPEGDQPIWRFAARDSQQLHLPIPDHLPDSFVFTACWTNRPRCSTSECSQSNPMVSTSWSAKRVAAEPVQWLKTTTVLHRLAQRSLKLYCEPPLPVPSSS